MLLAAQPDPRLRAYVVWVPKLGGTEADVPAATTVVSDTRARHFWDPSAVLVRSYDLVLGLHEDAWDVYLIYGAEARWTGLNPPEPAFWMHQLGSAAHPRVRGPYLEPRLFAAKADSLLLATSK